MTTFKEALKNDLAQITPSPALLCRVSEIMREEAEKPRVTPLKTAVRFAGMAAAVTLLAFGALYASGGVSTEISTNSDAAANDTAGIMPMNDAAEIMDEEGSLYYAESASDPAAEDFSGMSGAAETAPATTAFPRAQMDRIGWYDEPETAAPAEAFDEADGRAEAAAWDNDAETADWEAPSGGDEKAAYSMLFDWKLSAIEGGLIEIVGEEAFDRWRIGKESSGCTTDPSEDMNLYALILDFPQHKAAMEARLYEVLEIDRRNGWGITHLAEEEIDLLMNGEKEEIFAYFVSPAAIYRDGKIYSPEWLDTHTVAEYAAEGLPKEQLREKLDEILWLSNFMDLTSLAEKLSEYLGETVTVPDRIEPARTEEILTEAIPEDIPEDGADVPEEVIFEE